MSTAAAEAGPDAVAPSGPSRRSVASIDDRQDGDDRIVDDQEDDDGDEEDDDEEEEEGDAEQTIVDMGRHARMQRVQRVLFEQLQGNDARLSLELREKEEELRRVKSAREDVGVELYGVQQQLAQLQLALEGSHRQLAALHDARFASEDRLDSSKEAAGERKVQLEQHRASVFSTQRELDALNATLRQVERYNADMQAEIARTQRAAHKAEEQMQGLEKGKVQQDLYIDSLGEQLRALRDQIGAHAAQLKAQKLETAAADATLREAAAQMDAVAFEKKQLLQQWKSALVGMAQRDQALQATQAALGAAREEDLALATELRGYSHSITKAQAAHEALVATVERFQAEIRFVEEQLSALALEHARLAERHEMLTKSLRQTEAQGSSAGVQLKTLELEAAQAAQHLETTQRERHALEAAIAAQRSEQTTAHKAAHNLARETQRLQAAVHDKELALAALRNELARVGVDLLNVEAHTAQLEDARDRAVEELQSEDLAVERAELELRQRNDEIDKKMLRLDRLNKKFEQLVAKLEDENTGPLEAAVKSLAAETASKRRANAERQRAWLATQTALVALAGDAQELSERNQERTSRTSVLEQKQLRLARELDARRADAKALRAQLAAMHTDTSRLNELLAQHAARQSTLLDANHALELDFARELAALEAEAVALEARAAQLRLDKQELLGSVVEAERQLMLWEKKIQLEKETQAALDPDVGQAEARAMEKEIHRMRLRLEALERAQEQMVLDMEQAIRKRDLLALRGRAKADKGGDRADELSVAALQAKRATLQNRLRATDKDVKQLDAQVRARLVQGEDVAFQRDKAAAELQVDEERAAALQQRVNAALFDKQRLADAAARRHRLARRFDGWCRDAAQPEGPGNRKSSAQCEQDREQAQAALARAKDLVVALQKQHPHLSDVLARVLLLADEPAV